MIKRREPSQVPKMENQIDAFAAGADGGSVQPETESRTTFKSINVPLDKYEYSKLEALAKKANRSKLYMIRQAIIKLANEI